MMVKYAESMKPIMDVTKAIIFIFFIHPSRNFSGSINRLAFYPNLVNS